MYLIVFACIVCILMFCKYVSVFGLVRIDVYLHVLYVLACIVCTGICS